MVARRQIRSSKTSKQKVKIADDDPHVLFRFRDLVAPTLTAHQAVIDAHGAAWWGWWKRPMENARPDAWSLLADRLSNNDQVRILLFDSGRDEVHQAWITEVRPPPPGAVSDWEPVQLPKKDLALVPEYYRRSPFSRAWMKIVRIERNHPFFGAYSLAAAPRVSNYPPELLKRLEGKVIIDGAELRGMDTTIWLVRSARSSDNKDHLITAGAVPVAQPVSRNPIASKGSKILHITDPHFAIGTHRQQHRWRLESEKEDGRDTLAEAISRVVDKSTIGLVIVSGDLTFTGDALEFEEARRFLVRVAGNFGLGFEHIVVCPGNHDIQWKAASADDRVDVPLASDEAKANYATFYRNLFRHDSNPHLSMGRRFVLPTGVVVDVCALNSSSLATNDTLYPGVGRVQGAAFQAVQTELEWHDNTGLALRILAVHHHLVPTEDAENLEEFSSGFGLAIDAAKTQRMAARKNVQLVLHGHKHRAFLWRSTAYELPEEANPLGAVGDISIVGGGSAGSTEVTDHKNFFNVLDVQPRAIDLTIYRSKHGQEFQEMQVYRGELTLSNGRLLVGRWCV